MLGTIAAIVWLTRPSLPSCGASHLNEAASTSRSTAVAVGFAPIVPVVSGEARNLPVSCSLQELSADGFYAEVPVADHGRADLCGVYLDVRASPGNAPVLVLDRCPRCLAEQPDPSESAFAGIADSADGEPRVRYRLVRDPRPAPDPADEVTPDPSASWFAILPGGTEIGRR
ncbi:hypothetical protein OHA40_02145 [Nocardia sp. NBC_00508]|uniref:hypothetical protein n=1 Tax=Nocardia sp. NBC_00508 TaxID=2975992 RepID=UPI002E805A53|nr:hypothetical protein [Nocardia sp. NBC_00508]WUD66988.1 hypothetical protein OHA40_02145 [Nocardia sp. NBC_00508]